MQIVFLLDAHLFVLSLPFLLTFRYKEDLTLVCNS